MAKVERYSCDLCGKEFKDREQVGFSVLISQKNDGGDGWDDVCGSCVESLKLFLKEELIPKPI